MTSESERLNPALQGGAGEVSAAHQEREQRLAADAASMLAGRAPGHDEQLSYHQGAPSVEVQQATHGQRAPATPDVGGHQSASDPIC
jgi:hypothetical protein